MALSRRQFFRRFLGPTEDSPTAPESRAARYEVLETYVRTQLLPYDFALSEEQEQELYARVRKHLETVEDAELQSVFVRGQVEEVVEAALTPWREADRLQVQRERNREVREAGISSVNEFVHIFGSPSTLLALRRKLQATELEHLEGMLREEVRGWMASLSEEELLQYDIFTVKDVVFAKIRSLAEAE